MHISLDSALGQQRRLNQVGESITQIAPDPAAAYSLRSLTGSDPKVVRVRRGSDNHEQDFTASDVSSGALQDFVNAQVTAPLDIQALSATGRDGDFLIAKAAYSLRSLGTRQATLAATGDTVARANGKFVCQVRRDSDDALKSFTATEITDGTLVDFVGLIPNGVFANTGYESFTNASESGFTASNTGSTGFAISDIADGGSGNVINVSFDISITNGSPSISLRSSLAGGSLSSNSSTYTSSGSYTATLTATGSYVGVGFTEGDAPSNFTVSNFKVLGNGFVKTWYDQSVTTQAGDTATGNHATQATDANQPKIVSAGSLLTAGVTFDGDDSLSVSGDPVITASSSGVYSAFSVQTVATSEGGYLYGNASASNGTSAYALADKFTITNYFFADLDNIARASGQNLLSAVYNNGDAGLLVNGAGTVTDTGTYNFSAGTSDFIIGNRNGGSADATFLTGSINEIIIYNSNQTDNRTAIEANIGEAYSIDLPSGVDPGFDQVDGFVETWYDQSGNGKDATQTTAANQPKIVNAGALVVDSGIGGLDFDGDDFLTASSVSGLEGSISMFAVSVRDATGYVVSPSNSSAANRYFGIQEAASTVVANPRNTSNKTVSDSVSGNDRLTFVVTTGATSTSVGSNGSAVTTTTDDYGDDFAGSNLDQIAIGILRTVSASGQFNGRIREILVYSSDQTDNRTAVETNINGHYSIF
jgi:hypothetical protein